MRAGGARPLLLFCWIAVVANVRIDGQDELGRTERRDQEKASNSAGHASGGARSVGGRARRASKRGVVFKGGGFRAYATGLGFLAGMASHGVSVAEVFQNVDGIACSSGGCWISGMLLWSRRFNKMIPEMGYRPFSAAQVFMARLGNPWLQTLDKEAEAHPIKVACCSSKGLMPCGLGGRGLSAEIGLEGRRWCCPRQVVDDCRKKGWLACRAPRNERLFGDTKYCCLTNASSDAFEAARGCMSQEVRRSSRGALTMAGVYSWLFFTPDVYWKDLVRMIMDLPGDMDSGHALSAQPVSWAVGKDYVISVAFLSAVHDHSSGVLLMSHSGGPWRQARHLKAVGTRRAELAWESWRCFGDLCGTHVPGRFAVKLGSPESPLAVTSEAAEPALSQEYRIDERRWGLGWITSPDFTPELAEVRRSRDLPAWRRAHEVPFQYAASCSSAAIGGLNLFDAALIPGWFQAMLPSWVHQRFTASGAAMLAHQDTLASSNWKEAERRILESPYPDQAVAAEQAQDHLVMLSDAGFVDSTGLPHLLAADDYDEFVLIYNCVGYSHEVDQPALDSVWAYVTTNHSLFPMGASFAVFKETREQVKEQLKSFEYFPAHSRAEEFEGVYAGTLNLETVDSPAFGIVGGRAITLHMLIHNAIDIAIVSMEIYSIGILAGEITETYAAHAPLAQMVKGWLE